MSQFLLRKYPTSACIYIPLAKETLDEAEGVSFGAQSERRMDTRRDATSLRYIQDVTAAYVAMQNFALETQIPQHLQIYQHLEVYQ
jgi:hypothetical protein